MKLKLLYAKMFLLSAIIITCEPMDRLKQGAGFINVEGGKIWYNIIGKGHNTPIIMLHGGPGSPSHYLKPLAELGKDRPVIFYDQLGCGRSDRITDTSLMTVDRYIAELMEVISFLGLNDFIIYGHSWGAMLGTDYYLKYPEGIKALILSSPVLNVPMYLRDADSLVSTLPDSLQQVIRINEQNQTFDAPDYRPAVEVYYQTYLARKHPWSEDLLSSFSQFGRNVYEYMWGPSELTALGELKKYDRINQLGELKVPTLLLCGEFDTCRPETVKYYQSLIENSKSSITANAAHMTMHDNPQEDLAAINNFLSELEGKTN